MVWCGGRGGIVIIITHILVRHLAWRGGGSSARHHSSPLSWHLETEAGLEDSFMGWVYAGCVPVTAGGAGEGPKL